MRTILKSFIFVLILSSLLYGQDYSHRANVISAGGGESTGGDYSNFGLIGETIVNRNIENGTYNGHIGFIYMVIYPNNPPIVGDIPDLNLLTGQSAMLNLFNYVMDAENDPLEMNWTVEGTENLVVEIDNDIGVAEITIASEDWHGSETLLFTATDPDDLSDNDTVIVTVVILGDPSGDGELNEEDVICLFEHVLGVDPLSPAQFLAADANGDDKLDVLDVILLVTWIIEP